MLVGRRYLSAHSMESLLEEEKESKTVDKEVPAHHGLSNPIMPTSYALGLD